MVDHEIRLWFKRLFESFPGARAAFESSLGINPDELPTWLQRGGIEAVVGEETLRRQHEREEAIRQKTQEFQYKLARAQAEALRYSLNEIAHIIREGNREDAQRLEAMISTIRQGYASLPVQGADATSQKMAEGHFLPLHVTYMNCFRKHPKDDNNPDGRPGPAQCIYTLSKEEGLEVRCLVAYMAHNPGDKGFARLKYQIFHAPLLREGDCPRPLSRSISRRIPGFSWLFTKPDICPLADGKDHIIEYGAK